METNEQILRAKSLSWPALPAQTGRNGIDGHIRRLNADHPDGYGLYQVRHYLACQVQLKPQSLEVLAYGFQAAIRDVLGFDLLYDPTLQSIITTFFASYRVKRSKRTAPKCISYADLSEFVSKAPVTPRYFTEFLFLSSLRVSEMCAIRLSDIRIIRREVKNNGNSTIVEECVIRVTQKGSYSNEVVIPIDLYNEIRHVFRGSVYLFETRSGGQYRRQDVAAILRPQSEKILGYRITPHMLRHSFGQYVAEERPDMIRGAISQMGHSSPDTFFNYYVKQNFQSGVIPRLTGVAS